MSGTNPSAEQRLKSAASLIEGELYVYIHTRIPNMVRVEWEGGEPVDDQAFDLTLKQAIALRDWLNQVLP